MCFTVILVSFVWQRAATHLGWGKKIKCRDLWDSTASQSRPWRVQRQRSDWLPRWKGTRRWKRWLHCPARIPWWIQRRSWRQGICWLWIQGKIYLMLLWPDPLFLETSSEKPPAVRFDVELEFCEQYFASKFSSLYWKLCKFSSVWKVVDHTYDLQSAEFSSLENQNLLTVSVQAIFPGIKCVYATGTLACEGTAVIPAPCSESVTNVINQIGARNCRLLQLWLAQKSFLW